jgi:stage V sporulation protein R
MVCKIVHEGAASFWHAEIMYKYDGLTPEEYLDFVRTHEKVVQPGGNPFSINPYFLGFKIFKDIEVRWDEKYANGESDITGREKVFQVIKEENDISFIRNYLTTDLIKELKLFTYGYVEDYPKDHSDEKFIEIKDNVREEIVEAIVSPLYNGGVPNIVITGVGSEGALLMRHDSEVVGTLDFKFAENVLEYIWELWAAPIELCVKDDDGEEVILCFDEAGFHIDKEEEEFDLEENGGQIFKF